IPYGQGIGFAISAETINKVIPELIKNGRVIRPWVGFIFIDMSRSLARRIGITYTEGVIIQIYKGYAADKAGLRTTDVIVEASGKPIKNSEDLKAVIKTLKVGDKLPITAVREEKRIKFVLTVDELPSGVESV
ncbi:MAG: S1C family serine protease, partial [Armatimonadota bacterium]